MKKSLKKLLNLVPKKTEFLTVITTGPKMYHTWCIVYTYLIIEIVLTLLNEVWPGQTSEFNSNVFTHDRCMADILN